MLKRTPLARALAMAIGSMFLSGGVFASNDQDSDGIPDAIEIGQVPATCIANGYLTNSSDELYSIDLQAGNSALTHTFPININAIGYNPFDEKLWASSAVVSNPGGYLLDPVTYQQVDTFPLPVAYVSGDINTLNKTYVGARGSTNPVVVIDADPTSATYRTQVGTYDSPPIGVPDMVFDQNTGVFYAIGNNTNTLYSLDPDTGTWTTHGTVSGLPAGTYGSGFSVIDGRMFYSNNQTGDIYKIDSSASGFPATVAATLFATGPATGANDGARCSLVDLNGDPIPVDTDTDGTPDFLDTDSDDDGTPDSIELTVDNDSDGIPDYQDPDASGAASLDDDGDGLTNMVEALTGTDPANPDTDGDGLRDGDEVNTYSTDPVNPDTDGDGLADGVEVSTYSTDPTNPDTDGGGSSDGDEVAIGSDPLGNDGDDAQDSDGDGLSDVAELSLGTDPANPDSDADGLLDGQEANDLGTDPLNPDSDGDTLSDGTEVNSSLTDPTNADTDGDQLNDDQEVNILGTDPLLVDTDNDGLEDGAEVTTTQTDPLVADTDADGLSDGDEVATHATNPLNPDTDAGGAIDGGEINAGTNPLDPADDTPDLDADDDGIPDSVEGTADQDADGIANYLDRDSDNDGITDSTEAGGTDLNADGIIDDFTDANNDGFDDQTAANPLPLPDTDNDGIPDFLDTDSDQDGLSDIFEAGGVDSNDDGKVDNFTDADGDGIDDETLASPLPLTDTDSDATPNYLDLDSDNDGITDLAEIGAPDLNADGMIDLFVDTDGDGIPDHADIDATDGTDSDGDGIIDLADVDSTAGADINGNGIDDSFDADADGDGRATIVANDVTTLPDSDADGIPDVIDTEADTGTGNNTGSGEIITGISGGAAGCSIVDGAPGKIDPVLPLSLMALLGLVTRRASRRK